MKQTGNPCSCTKGEQSRSAPSAMRFTGARQPRSGQTHHVLRNSNGHWIIYVINYFWSIWSALLANVIFAESTAPVRAYALTKTSSTATGEERHFLNWTHTPLALLSHNAVHTWKCKQLNAYSSWSGCLSTHNLSLQGFFLNIPTCRAINQSEREQSRPTEEQEKGNNIAGRVPKGSD